MRGIVRSIGVLAVLVALVFFAWIFRDRLIALWQDLRGDDAVAEVSPELAERAEEKLAVMNRPQPPDRVSLTSDELQSLVAYRMAPTLPPFILAPVVTVVDGELRVRARVATEQVAGMRSVGGAEELLSMLPDTTDVEAKGHLIPLGGGRVGLAIDDVSAASIPLPARVIPRILESVGRVDEPGLPREALAVRLPTGVASAFAHGDSIVFVGRESPAGRTGE